MSPAASYGPGLADLTGARRAFWIAFAVYIAILPLEGTTALRNLAFFAMLGCLAQESWRKKMLPRVPVRWPWLAFALPALLSLPPAVNGAYSAGELKPELLYPFLLFSLAATAIDGPRAFLRFLAILAGANAVLVAFSLGSTLLGVGTKDGLVGTVFTGVGYYSTYMVAVMPFILVFLLHQKETGRKGLAWGGLALLLGGLASLYFTGNRQAFVALFAEVVVGLALARRARSGRHLAMAAGVLAIFALLFVFVFLQRVPEAGRDFGLALQSDPRWHTWQVCIGRLLEHPWTGSGFGLRTFQWAYPDLAADSPFWHAHNVLLNKAVQMGLAGLLGFLVLYLAVLRRLCQGIGRPGLAGAAALAGAAMAVGFLVKNMTDDFFYRQIGYVFWLLAGAVAGLIGSVPRRAEAA